MKLVGCGDPAGTEPEPAVKLNNQVVFVSDRDGDKEIFVMNADGSGSIINLTENPSHDSEPYWSPVE